MPQGSLFGACQTGGNMHGGTCHSKPPISHDDPQRQFDNTIKPKGKQLSTGKGSHTILFTVETQEELCRGFYPSIGGAFG